MAKCEHSIFLKRKRVTKRHCFLFNSHGSVFILKWSKVWKKIILALQFVPPRLNSLIWNWPDAGIWWSIIWRVTRCLHDEARRQNILWKIEDILIFFIIFCVKVWTRQNRAPWSPSSLPTTSTIKRSTRPSGDGLVHSDLEFSRLDHSFSIIHHSLLLSSSPNQDWFGFWCVCCPGLN